MNDIWDALALSRDDLDTIQIESEKALSKVDTAVTRSEDALGESEERLADLLAPADALDVDAGKADLNLALLALQTDEENLAALKGAPDALDANALRLQVTLASARLATAEADMAALELGPEEAELDASRKALSLAEAALAASCQSRPLKALSRSSSARTRWSGSRSRAGSPTWR
jgi:hypothetical protein